MKMKIKTLSLRPKNIILQKNSTDCGVCSLSMALGKPYQEILNLATSLKVYDLIDGIHGETAILDQYHQGYNLISEENIPKNFKTLLKNKKALITASLKSDPLVDHLMYWDGKTLFDPEPSMYYTTLEELTPTELCILK